MDMESGRNPVRELVKEKSVTMEYFLETSHLDATTAEMLKKYDKDGNGSFSKDEVVAIVLDLREAMHSNELLGKSNKMFKRLFLAVTFFSLLLLTSIFGLSYAVAALTRNTDVQSDGLMLTRDGSAIIATDNIANTYSVGTDASGQTCMPLAEGLTIVTNAVQGRNVLLTVGDGTSKHTYGIGAAGMDVSEDRACFWDPATQSQNCLTLIEGEDCDPVDANGRRKLQDEVPEGLELLTLEVATELGCRDPRTQECKDADQSNLPSNCEAFDNTLDQCFDERSLVGMSCLMCLTIQTGGDFTFEFFIAGSRRKVGFEIAR